MTIVEEKELLLLGVISYRTIFLWWPPSNLKTNYNCLLTYAVMRSQILFSGLNHHIDIYIVNCNTCITKYYDTNEMLSYNNSITRSVC